MTKFTSDIRAIAWRDELRAITFFAAPAFAPTRLVDLATCADGGPKELRACNGELSALMRSAHQLHGLFDMAPLAGLFRISLVLARDRILGGLGDGRRAMLLEHLPRNGVNLHLGYHVDFPIACSRGNLAIVPAQYRVLFQPLKQRFRSAILDKMFRALRNRARANTRDPKTSQSFCEWILTHSGELHMRVASALFAGSVAALAVLTTPVLAKNSHTQKTDEKSASSTCHSYQMAADGSWTALPCEELGTPSHAQRNSSTQSPDEHSR